MNKYIKDNFNKIIPIFILLQPILDLITGICVHTLNINVTLGIVIRVLFLLFLMYTTVFVYKKKFSLYTYLAICIYSILYLIGIIVYKDGVVFYELQGLLKALYFPLVLVSLYDLKDEFKVSKMTLFTTLFTYLLLILIPNTFGLGFDSYKITKSGNLGFFNAANEISGIISLLTPIMFIILKELKNKILKVVFALIYLVVILTIGTKTPLLTLLITIGFTYLYYMIHCLKQKTYKPIVFTGIAIIVAFGSLMLVLPKTNFYKNIKVHLDFLEVDNIIDVFKEKDLIDHFIFSQRLTFLENKSQEYAEAATYEKIFGIGYTEEGKQTKLIEMDYFDIFYSHGLVGFIILFGVYFIVLIKTFTTSKKQTYESFMIKLSIFLILILSLFTGHIITAPAVSIVAVSLILATVKRTKKDLLFTAVNFDIGGIETALLNLLNHIDYTKYNVKVILEEKTGILLERINPNASVEELAVSTNKNIIVRKLTNLFRKQWFNLLHYHNYDFSCCYATYSLSGNKLALIASKNNSIYIHSNYKYIYKTNAEILNFFNSRHISEFKHIFIVSNEAKESFVSLYKDLEPKCHVYNNFIDIDLITHKSKVKIDAKKGQNKLLVFVGRLEEHSKKLTRAINLIKEIPNVDLWIIGDGPDRQKYEDLVTKYKLTKRITFFGKKENPYPYMIQADYIILTSDYEGFPVTYLEAIILEKDIITTIDVSDDQISIGKDFAYIISKDEKEMIKEVKEILNKHSKRKKIDFQKIQNNRMQNLTNFFDEVMM